MFVCDKVKTIYVCIIEPVSVNKYKDQNVYTIT